MCCGRNRGILLPGNIPGNPDQAAHVAQLEGQVALAVRAPSGFPDDLINCTLVEVRDLPVVFDFLCNEPYVLLAVLGSILHALRHIDLIPVPADTGAEGRVHALDCIKVPGGHHHKPAGHRLGPDHRTARTLALAGDREFTFLKGCEEVLLGVRVKGIDLIDKEDSAIRAVDRTGFHTIVRRSLKAPALERVVPDIPKECPCMGAGPVNKRCDILGVIGDKELWHHGLFTGGGIPQGHEDECTCDQPHQELHGDDRVSCNTEQEEHQKCLAELDLLLCLSLVGTNDLLAATGGYGPDYRVIGIIGVRIDQNVQQFFLWQELGHCFCKHRLAGTGAANHHDVPALDRRLLDDFHRTLLADHLVDQFCGYFDLR